MESDNESENSNNNKDIKNVKINVFYMNNKINNIPLPSSLNEFRIQVKNIFLIENRTNEEISFIYFYITNNKKEKDKLIEKIIDVKTDTDYSTMIDRIKSNNIKDGTIYIETDKIPDETSRKNSKNFEEEIQYLVESELKSAGERIKKYLSANKNCFILTKNKENKKCSRCQKDIAGNIYKSVTNIEEIYFCEKCSYIQKDPVFIIH